MGLQSLNFRILPKGCYIEKIDDCWKVCGQSSMKEANLLSILSFAKVDIMINTHSSIENANEYLLNKGIEMLVWLANDKIQYLELRVCLSWYEEAIKELFDMLYIINREYELYDWINNEEGIPIDDYQSFRDAHISYNTDKIELYKRSDYAKNVRLTEGELGSYKNKTIFGYRRNFKYYKPYLAD